MYHPTIIDLSFLFTFFVVNTTCKFRWRRERITVYDCVQVPVICIGGF